MLYPTELQRLTLKYGLTMRFFAIRSGGRLYEKLLIFCLAANHLVNSGSVFLTLYLPLLLAPNFGFASNI